MDEKLTPQQLEKRKKDQQRFDIENSLRTMWYEFLEEHSIPVYEVDTLIMNTAEYIIKRVDQSRDNGMIESIDRYAYQCGTMRVEPSTQSLKLFQDGQKKAHAERLKERFQ